MTHAMNQERVKRFGKYFGSIDFELNQSLTVETIRSRKADTIVGTFHLDGREYPMTMAELDRIIETAEAAKNTFFKSYTMGKYGKY